MTAGWDGIGSVTDSGIVIAAFPVFIGVLSYAVLAGAIFKARGISPTRAFSAALAARMQTAGAFAVPSPATVPLSAADGPGGD